MLFVAIVLIVFWVFVLPGYSGDPMTVDSSIHDLDRRLGRIESLLQNRLSDSRLEQQLACMEGVLRGPPPAAPIASCLRRLGRFPRPRPSRCFFRRCRMVSPEVRQHRLQLAIEVVDDLFEKHGKPRIARSPLPLQDRRTAVFRARRGFSAQLENSSPAGSGQVSHIREQEEALT